MKITAIAVIVGAAIHAVAAFTPSRQKSVLSAFLRETVAKNSADILPPIRWSEERQHGSSTRLHMAFKTDQPTNMFDGPMPLVKERDACGVGFIANTKSGGE